jgi:DNA-binding beta-propeller fold protein YncE
MTDRTRPALAAALLAALAACSHAKPREDVVWPPPPEVARIKFVTAFTNGDDLDPSGWTRFKRAILGGKPDTIIRQPMGLAISDDGQRLYVGDIRAGRVLVVDLPAKRMRWLAPDSPPMGQILGVALDAQENVYVADSSGHGVTAFSKDGKRLWVVQDDLERPTGLAVDAKRQILYVADGSRVGSTKHRVLRYDLQGKRTGEVGRGIGGEPGQFYFPVYLAVDAQGNLYVGDTMNFRVQVFDPEGRFLRAYGEHGDGPGTFSRLKGIAFDGFGNVYVVDGGPGVVQIFNADLQPLMFFGGQAPLLEYFDIPSCIAIDRTRNRIYVCNEQNGRINVYDLVNTTAADSRSAK